MFEERIRDAYTSLTPGFRKIADFITDHTLDAAFLTTTELARRVGVDQATVVRFAQSIGYSGYRELSQEIEAYVLQKVTAGYRKAAEAKTEMQVIEGLAENSEQMLRECLATEGEKIADAVHLLQEASHIWIAAEFVMYHLAEYAAHVLRSLNIPATAVHPTTQMSGTVLARMEADDALLAFTLYFPHVDTGHLVRMAREQGLHTINITDYSNGLAAREAEITIKTSTASPLLLPSVGPAFNILQIMIAAVIAQRSEHSAKAWVDHNDYLGRILEMRAQMPKAGGIADYRG
ncbi:MAG: MurR/RpiR family transcriptional regulator [Anaerolineae bacterium]